MAFLLLWALHLPYWGFRIRVLLQLLPPWRGPRLMDGWFRLRRDYGRRLFWLAERVCKMTFLLEGAVPPPGSYVLVCNHQSSADIIVLLGGFDQLRCRFLAKHSLRWFLPFVSPSLRNTGDGFLSGQPQHDLPAIRQFAEGLAADRACGVSFPEGVRTLDGGLGAFRTGGLERLCRHARLPIVPVAVDGLWQARTMGGYFRHLPYSTVRLWAGEAVPFERFEADPKATMAALHKAIEQRLQIWRSSPAASTANDAAMLAESPRPADSTDGNEP